ncbi:MAG: pseudouridine synthase [Ignavibacteriae bacterium]|nr:pseudouridine synthase [Ignavibacteriota bacterium]
MRHHYILVNKPFGVLSQFTPEGDRPTLRNLGSFPPTVYPAGRLDADSEGLLLLTDDNEVKHRLTEPRFQHPRTYLVQVEQVPTEEALENLRSGVTIEKRKTRPVEVRLLDKEPDLPLRVVPIRFRKNVSTAWLEMSLREGRNRQVRRMTASIGHPTLRLVRIRIGVLSLEGLSVGEHRELTRSEIIHLRQSLNLSA